MNENCTLWTLRVAWFKSVFFASFLCRFGQRNDALPRAVANSDKEISQPKYITNRESNNPALTPTANLSNTNPASTNAQAQPANPKSNPKCERNQLSYCHESSHL
jgi:hypothetical protein